jgi:hypothetical protein
MMKTDDRVLFPSWSGVILAILKSAQQLAKGGFSKETTGFVRNGFVT